MSHFKSSMVYTAMRKFEIKGAVLEGYSVWVDTTKYNNIADICNFCKTHLLNFLKTFNLKHLYAYANNMTLTTNIYSSYNDMIRITTDKDTIYLVENQKPMDVLPEIEEELE